MLTNLEPKIGRWSSVCCVEDLYEIKDEDDVEYYSDEEDGMQRIGCWKTKEDAIKELIELDGNDISEHTKKRLGIS